MDYKNSEQGKMKIAIILARMYGVKETLEALPYISNEKMIVLAERWTEKYFDKGEGDIISFFESRFCDNESF